MSEEINQAYGPVSTDSDENKMESEPGQKGKISKKKMAIIGAAVLAVIVIATIFFIPSKFERVKDECVRMAGQAATGKGYFTLDTYPDTYKNMDPTVRALLLDSTQKNTLEAIRYANKELGFNESVYSRMLKTSALMGRQTEENGKYKVSWSYHPDEGLEVTYEKK